MPRFNNYIIDQLIAPAFVWFFFIGGIVAVLIGVGLIMRSPRIFRLFDLLNHSVSTRAATKPLSIPRDSEPFFLKYRVPAGVIFVVGALYADYGLLTGAGNATIVTMLNSKLPPGFMFWIVESLRYFLMVSCTVAIIVGVLLLLSPDTLKSVESAGARWYSTRKIAPDADNLNLSFDNWVRTFPRTAGLIIIFPALGMIVHFGDLILRGI